MMEGIGSRNLGHAFDNQGQIGKKQLLQQKERHLMVGPIMKVGEHFRCSKFFGLSK